MGLPSPAGLKKVVLKFLSVRSIVIAPAKTGRESNKRNAVIRTDHTNRGILSMETPGALILKMVVMKFIAPRMELAPSRWRLNIAISTAPPECA